MLKKQDVFGEEAMLEFGQRLAEFFKEGAVVYLDGDLGMGKTTLVRGMLRGLGYEGPVKSPTYTIVEPYDVSGLDVYHFDLYRVTDPEELEYIGIRDYFSANTLSFIEWADMGRGVLPEADVIIHIGLVKSGREVVVESVSSKGDSLLSSWLA